MAEARSVEAQDLEAQEALDGPESMPNEPQWLFDGSVPEDERARYTSDVVAALKTVFDPEIPCDIYELGLIYKVEIDDDRMIKIEMTLTSPGCPVAGELTRTIETVAGAVPGIQGVHVTVVFEPPWGPGRMSEEARVSLDMF